jgi:hypothetical protein
MDGDEFKDLLTGRFPDALWRCFAASWDEGDDFWIRRCDPVMEDGW